MGRGVISGGGTDGQYTVELDYGQDVADEIIAQLSLQASVLETEIDAIEIEIAALESAQTALQLSLNAAITTYNDSEKTKDDQEALALISVSVEANSKLLRSKNARLGIKRLSLSNAESRIAFLEGQAFTESKSVWCADLTEDGSGAVDTIEVNAEQGTQILVAPGAPAYNQSSGYLRARCVMSPEQAFYNAAILPGVQKFKPTYRTGTISNIDYDNDTCTVTLDSANSSAQNLGINQSAVLTGVDIEYMTCNSGAFEDDDKVVVQFAGQSWSSPKVIGFESNPRACSPAYLMFYLEPSEIFAVSGTGSADGHLAPLSDSVQTYPAYGQSLKSLEYEYVPRITFAIMGYSADPIMHHQKYRIRWDVSFVKGRAEDPAFEFGGAQTVQGYTTHLDISPTVSTSTSFFSPSCEEQTTDFQVSPTDYGGWTYFPAWISFDDEYPLVHGTATSNYYRAEVNWQEVHRVARSDWMKDRLEPPASIEVEINGKLQTYVFDSIGSPPARVRDDGDGPYFIKQVPDEEIPIPVVSPPSGGGPTVSGYTSPLRTSTYEINFYEGIGPPNVVFYRREGTPVMALR